MLNYPYNELPRYSIDAYGIRTGYYASGDPDGQLVLLLHGMSTSADSFREIMHELGDAYYLIAPDIPGFGYSATTNPYTIPHLVEWLAAFVEKLGRPPAALIGHSFGGILAASYAAWYPDEVTRLLLLAPAILRGASYPDLLKKVGISLGLLNLGTAVSQSKLLVKRQIRVPFYDPAQQHESVWERRLADYDRARASAKVMSAVAHCDLRPYLAQIQQPTCLVWGENDAVVPHTDADELAGYIPDTTIHKLPECGHLPMLEQSGQFLTIARDFLGNGQNNHHQ